MLCCVASSGCGCCYCRGDAIARRPAGCMMMSSSIDWGVVAQWGKYETRVASHRSIPFVSCPFLSSVCVCFCVSVTQWVFRGRSLHPLWWMDSNCSFVWRPNTPPPPPPPSRSRVQWEDSDHDHRNLLLHPVRVRIRIRVQYRFHDWFIVIFFPFFPFFPLEE